MVLTQNNVTSCRKAELCQNLSLFIWSLLPTELFLILSLFRVFLHEIWLLAVWKLHAVSACVSSPSRGLCLSSFSVTKPVRVKTWSNVIFWRGQHNTAEKCEVMFHSWRLRQLHFSWFTWQSIGGSRSNWLAARWLGKDMLLCSRPTALLP